MLIYLIRNMVNDKVYIGQHRGTNLTRRWRQHIKAAESGSPFIIHNARSARRIGMKAT